MRHKLSPFVAGLFGLAILAATPYAVTPVAAATLAATTTCSNGVNNAGGEGLICEVTIENTLTAVGGSATVTVRECHGAAGDPEALCTTQVSVLTEPVTSVDQCNGSINGGGGTLRCSVQVRNTYVAEDPSPVGVSVNQCVGSGDGFTVGCDPFPATATGATITQCNGSANGGTLVELTCDATGTQSDAFNVTINQCNGSGNGGGGPGDLLLEHRQRGRGPCSDSGAHSRSDCRSDSRTDGRPDRGTDQWCRRTSDRGTDQWWRRTSDRGSNERCRRPSDGWSRGRPIDGSR